MASIRKLSSGKWNVQVRKLGYPTQTKSFNEHKDAQRWAKSVETDMDKGVFVDRSSAEGTTLGEVLDRYLQEVSPHKKGHEEEAYRIGIFKSLPLSERSLASIKPADIAAYRDDRLKEASSGTVRRDIDLLSHVFTIARKEWSFAIGNPVQDIRKPKPGKPRTRRLEGDEYQRLVGACSMSRNPQLEPLVILAVETAMRLGELLSLTWENVDLVKRTAFLADTKNGTARTVPLSMLAVKTLSGMCCSIDSRRVFFSYKNHDSINQSWRTALNHAGIKELRFHDLRHSAVSLLFELGLNQFEVAKISGHKTMTMLARYTHLTEDHIISKLDQRRL